MNKYDILILMKQIIRIIIMQKDKCKIIKMIKINYIK